MNYTQKKLKELNQDLTRIMADGSDEKVMIFTDDKVLAELADLINRLLEDRRTLKGRLPVSGECFQEDAVQYFP